MQEDLNKKLDKLTRNLLSDLPIESPSKDFTANVMARVDAFENALIFEYKPVISKKVWIIIGVVLLLVFLYLFFGDVEDQNSLLSAKQLSWMPNFGSISMPDYEISNIFLYGIIGFTFFMSVQIILLKNHFGKRFA